MRVPCLVFVAGRKLKKVALAGGAPITLAETSWFRGSVWGDDGSIYFVPNVYVPISRIPASGGVAQPVTTILQDAGEVHRWPALLPGGKVLLYGVGPGTVPVRSLDPPTFGPPAALFSARLEEAVDRRYDVFPDGQRFLLNRSLVEEHEPIAVVLGWTARLEQEPRP